MEPSDPDLARLIIPNSIRDSMIAHCRACYPNEACGILAGKGAIVSEIFAMTNVDKSPASYLMDPEEQFRMMKELRDRSLQMTAIYHSHPGSPPYPSGKDLEMAYYEDVVYVIISLAESEPAVRGFSIRNAVVCEVRLSVISSSQM